MKYNFFEIKMLSNILKQRSQIQRMITQSSARGFAAIDAKNFNLESVKPADIHDSTP